MVTKNYKNARLLEVENLINFTNNVYVNLIWKKLIKIILHFLLRSHTYLQSIETILKSIVWVDVKMLVAPWTTHSLVSGMAIGVHHDTKTDSFLEQSGRKPENFPSINTIYKLKSFIRTNFYFISRKLFLLFSH